MTSVTTAFHRWLAAEQDASDATRLLLSMVMNGDAGEVTGQQAVVRMLRQEAHELLHEYLAAVQTASSQLGYINGPPPHRKKKGPQRGRARGRDGSAGRCRPGKTIFSLRKTSGRRTTPLDIDELSGPDRDSLPCP